MRGYEGKKGKREKGKEEAKDAGRLGGRGNCGLRNVECHAH